jgi:tetratricopeptide (TPR) repeat protein
MGPSLSQHELEAAEEQYRAARIEYQAIGDRCGAALCLVGLAKVAFQRHEFDESEKIYVSALAEFPIHFVPIDEDKGLSEDPADTAGRMKRSRTEYIIGHSRWGIAECERALGDLAFRRSSFADAGDHYYVAMSHYDAVGDAQGVANTRGCLGLVAIEQRRLSRAFDLIRAALRTFKEIGDRHGEMSSLSDLARIAHDGKRPAQAILLADESLKLAREDRDGDEQIKSLMI